jgi:predicted N-acetyltransferase YhbS
VKIRQLERHEIRDLWSIDRTERVEHVYRYENGELVLVPEHHETRRWPPGEPEHYGPILRDCLDHGGTCYGAFDREVLIGGAVLESRFIGPAKDQLQLKFLHVSNGHRWAGLGRTLFEMALTRARELDARRLYVSSTSSENTVRFNLGLGCRVTNEVDPDLFALEPDDIHLTCDIPG